MKLARVVIAVLAAILAASALTGCATRIGGGYVSTDKPTKVLAIFADLTSSVTANDRVRFRAIADKAISIQKGKSRVLMYQFATSVAKRYDRHVRTARQTQKAVDDFITAPPIPDRGTFYVPVLNEVNSICTANPGLQVMVVLLSDGGINDPHSTEDAVKQIADVQNLAKVVVAPVDTRQLDDKGRVNHIRTNLETMFAPLGSRFACAGWSDVASVYDFLREEGEVK